MKKASVRGIRVLMLMTGYEVPATERATETEPVAAAPVAAEPVADAPATKTETAATPAAPVAAAPVANKPATEQKKEKKGFFANCCGGGGIDK